jgi:hypothetical protein
MAYQQRCTLACSGYPTISGHTFGRACALVCAARLSTISTGPTDARTEKQYSMANR